MHNFKSLKNKMNLLFVCGRNKWRSPTAARLYQNDERVSVRSAGMSAKSAHQISVQDLEWADLVLVMEQNYKAHILGIYRDYKLPLIEVLDIPDEYEYMNEELISMIKQSVEYLISTRSRYPRN
jgi:protein-tyrosine phosphatase